MDEVPNLTAALLLVAFAWVLAGVMWLADWTRAERIRRELHTIRHNDQEGRR